jgi:hypothetical protein
MGLCNGDGWVVIMWCDNCDVMVIVKWELHTGKCINGVMQVWLHQCE